MAEPSFDPNQPFALEGSAAPQFDPSKPFQEVAGDNRGIIDKLTGTGGARYQTWPEKLVRGVASSLKSAVTLPGDVYAGRDAPDNTARVLDLAAIANPLSPGISRGGVVPASQSAAATSAELGAPLPRGIASENRGIQAVTQAARQLPFVGQKIESRAASTVEGAGSAVGNIANELGAADRATLGGNLRGSLVDVIDSNKQSMNASYDSVRSLIDPKAAFIPERTKQVLDTIKARRAEAGQVNPSAGLEQIENIVDKGINFDGLIRAKSDLAHSVDFLNAHAGFSNADKKQLGAAMSYDLGQITAKSTAPGANPGSAIAALRQAESEASKIIEGNKTLGKLANNNRDEGIASIVLNAASAKNGNLGLIAQLRSQLPAKDFEQIGGTVLNELGYNPARGSFSLNQFATNWEKMSPTARSTLFSKQHGEFLGDIAKLGKYLKNADSYANSSHSGRAVVLAGLISAAGTAGVAAAMGHYAPILSLGASVVGGYSLAQYLARPAVAASMARVARAAITYDKSPSITNRAMLQLASKNATTNLAAAANTTPSEFIRLLQAPVKGAAESDQPEIPRPPSQ